MWFCAAYPTHLQAWPSATWTVFLPLHSANFSFSWHFFFFLISSSQMKTITLWITVYKYVHQSTHQGPLFQVWAWTDAYLSPPSPTPAYFSHAHTRELCIHSGWYCLIARLLLPLEPPFLQWRFGQQHGTVVVPRGQKGHTASRRMEFCCVHTNCHMPLAILSVWHISSDVADW